MEDREREGERERERERDRSKARVREEDATKRCEHAENLPRQGQLMRMTKAGASEIWCDAVKSLPSESLKLAAHENDRSWSI